MARSRYRRFWPITLCLALALAAQGCGGAISRTPVESSNLKSVGYDESQRVLVVEFHSGGVYEYRDVPPEIYQGLMAAESKGHYFWEHVRRAGFRYKRLDAQQTGRP